ncbi:hypothetical protein [Arthrobacter sp. lap29]|uniref:hypothetical protein n=1 Tax=Arthrobacter sp. lap29 TaxID=3056122 RepID=UPI0028F73E58|nr:hypothetical protein [Arthrobacter sp. lap29]
MTEDNQERILWTEATPDQAVWKIVSQWRDQPIAELSSMATDWLEEDYASASRVLAGMEADRASDAWSAGQVSLAPAHAQRPSDPFALLMLAGEALSVKAGAKSGGGDSDKGSVLYSLTASIMQLATAVQRHTKED